MEAKKGVGWYLFNQLLLIGCGEVVIEVMNQVVCTSFRR